MIARSPRARSGITLTEILISILIMGIGLISLATLFPLGLIRLREATRYQRGGILAQSGSDDLDARGLLIKGSFGQTWYSGTQTIGAITVPMDPFTIDLAPGNANPIQTRFGFDVPQPGLPVVYDPLWRAVTNVVPPTDALGGGFDYDYTGKSYRSAAADARFGAGLVVDANQGTVNAFKVTAYPGDNNVPSAWGLQRITNFIPWSPKNAYLYPLTYQNPGIAGTQAVDAAGDTFTSIDDIVFNSLEGGAREPSSLLPDLRLTPNAVPTSDWRFSWFFTGRQVDSTNGTMFQGDVVVCDSRPFAFGPLPGQSASVPIGESVVEAIYGFSTHVFPLPTGFGVGADRTILIRWPVTIADPQVRIGGWIADTTYERDATRSSTRISFTGSPFQRCSWYQIVRRTEAEDESALSAGPQNPGSYRRMTLTVSSPVRAKTAVSAGGIPVYANVATIMPSVINVYPRSFTVQ